MKTNIKEKFDKIVRGQNQRYKIKKNSNNPLTMKNKQCSKTQRNKVKNKKSRSKHNKI